MVTTITLLFLLFIHRIAGEDYSNQQVWKVWARNTSDAELLHKMQSDALIDLWSRVPIAGDKHTLVSLRSKHAPTITELLRKYAIPFAVRSDNLQKMVDESMSANSSSPRAGFDLYKYNAFGEIHEFLKTTAKNYPHLVKLRDIGTGALKKNPMIVMDFDIDRKVAKKKVFIDCGIHPREWISISFCLYLIHILSVESQTTGKKILEIYNVHVLAVYNPDGYIYTWSAGHRIWRKSMGPTHVKDCIGVDLNRNFDIQFGKTGGSDNPCSEDYYGPKGNSEMETKNFLAYIDSQGSWKAYFNVHSFSQLWVYPYGYKKDSPSNVIKLKALSVAATLAIKAKHGETYNTGTVADRLYPASGLSVDYLYDIKNIKYAFVLELRDKGKHGFLLPDTLIKPTVEEVFAGFAMALKGM